jgi:ankyrin repeat protein
VIALLEAGANVNHKDKNKKTPMDWAIEQKRMEIREILKNAGGTANLKK